MPANFDDIKPESHQITPIDHSKLERSTPKPITRADRASLQKANCIELEPQDFTSHADSSLRDQLVKVDDLISQEEANKARDMVDSVMPEFMRWRTAQSPDRVASHIQDYGQEVAESLTPKFHSFGEQLGAQLDSVSASVLAELTA
jgi:hypothetical protein